MKESSENSETFASGYDALGRRIFKTVDGQMTRYIFEGIHIVASATWNLELGTMKKNLSTATPSMTRSIRRRTELVQ